jgi:hypothetical protein
MMRNRFTSSQAIAISHINTVKTGGYVFAAHADEAHPHVHLVVLARGRGGRRLNPRKADL